MSPVPIESYGPVVVLGDSGAIRVGYYDDDEWIEGPDDDETWIEGSSDWDAAAEKARRAVVYYSEPPFLFDNRHHLVSPQALRPVDTEYLFRRRDSLASELFEASGQSSGRKRRLNGDSTDPYGLLLEWAYLNSLLAGRMLEARAHEGDAGGRRVFISHSSTDKRTAVAISVDLANRGHVPWLDEWEIAAGDSIPVKISDGLEQSDFVLVLMSAIAVESGWVEAEWTAKYWEEVNTREVRVIPVLLEECKVPALLRTKKYADLRTDYAAGLDEVLMAIR
jgi:hypothetical protein